jgi:hypothetical protein
MPDNSGQQKQGMDFQSTFEDELDWEEWNPSKISFHHHMIAGSAAGLVEHIGMFPIDTIKTYIQYDSKGTINFQSISKQILEREGFFRLWRGVGAMFAGCIPGTFYGTSVSLFPLMYLTTLLYLSK